MARCSRRPSRRRAADGDGAAARQSAGRRCAGAGARGGPVGPMRLRLAGRRLVVDTPHVAFVSAIVGFCAWYLFDARGASTNVQNLLLIEPTAILVFVLYAFILRDAVTIERPA